MSTLLSSSDVQGGGGLKYLPVSHNRIREKVMPTVPELRKNPAKIRYQEAWPTAFGISMVVQKMVVGH
jgi:hypothetical protein